jgi:hypothetical protein
VVGRLIKAFRFFKLQVFAFVQAVVLAKLGWMVEKPDPFDQN